MTNAWPTVILGLLVVLVALPIISYLVEALRPAPTTPTQLKWDSQIPIRYVEVDGIKLRYITVGEGSPLVLLHTLRTQLDMFQKVIPQLSQHFQVYAVDYPGHGFSDIPKVHYTPSFFAASVSRFLDMMDIKGATVAGVSIGGTLTLILAAEHNPRVKKAIAINPYDYDAGRGVLRSSWLAKLLFSLNNVPIIGSTNWRLRTLLAFRTIMQGGVYHHDAIPPALLREMNAVGNRPHHYRAFMSLAGHFPEWEKVRMEYPKIEIPVLLVYGDHDWSRPEEREANQRTIPGAQITTVKDGGHFLSLDAPQAVIQLILDFSHAKAEGAGSSLDPS